MVRLGFWIAILGIIIAGCVQTGSSAEIIKIIDFEVSPDEDKVAFSALTPIGNTDIWVVGIDGANLKKLTFKDRSLSNHIARFFKKHKWRNFFEIDMYSPEWTVDGRIVFCQRLTKYDMWGFHVVSVRYWTIKPDGTDLRQRTEKDKAIQGRAFGPVNKYKISEQIEKYKKKIFLKDDTLWTLDDGDAIPKKLIK